MRNIHSGLFTLYFLSFLPHSLGFLPRSAEGSIRRSFGRERIFGETSARGVKQTFSHDSNDPQFKWRKNKPRNCEPQYINIVALRN